MIMTTSELAERWGCSTFHIYKLTRQGTIPHFKLGTKIIRFRLEDIEKYECQNSSSTEANGASTVVTPVGALSGDLSGPQTVARQNEGQQTFRPSSYFVPPLTEGR